MGGKEGGYIVYTPWLAQVDEIRNTLHIAIVLQFHHAALEYTSFNINGKSNFKTLLFNEFY